MGAADDAIKGSSLPYVDNDGITAFEKGMDIVLGVSFYNLSFAFNCFCESISSHPLPNTSKGLLLCNGSRFLYSSKSKLSAIEFSLRRRRNRGNNRLLFSHFLGQFLACYLVSGPRKCVAAFLHTICGLRLG